MCVWSEYLDAWMNLNVRSIPTWALACKVNTFGTKLKVLRLQNVTKNIKELCFFYNRGCFS